MLEDILLREAGVIFWIKNMSDIRIPLGFIDIVSSKEGEF